MGIENDPSSETTIHLDEGELPPLPDFTTTTTPPIPLPPIYWINLDSSIPRRRFMEHLFWSLPVPPQSTTRVPAVNVTTVQQMLTPSSTPPRLLLHPAITLIEQQQQKDSTIDTSIDPRLYNHYHMSEVACTLSHLHAIHQAYQDGHDFVLILEDDAVLTPSLVGEYHARLIQAAPPDWHVLQWFTWHPGTVAQSRTMERTTNSDEDAILYTSWQPFHWSTMAYVIHRRGMEEILAHTLYTNAAADVVWHLDAAPLVVADEVIYHYAGSTTTGGAYTLTQPQGMLNSAGFGSVVQRTGADHAPLVGDSSSSSNNTRPSPQQPHETSSILVITTLPLLKHAEQIPSALDQLQQDHQALCGQYYNGQVCDWHVLVVLARADLRTAWEEQGHSRHRARHEPRIQWTVRVVEEEEPPATPQQHSMWQVEHLLEAIMSVSTTAALPDHVLILDAQQRLTGFPWRTFLAAKGSARLAAPLFQSTLEGCHYRQLGRQQQEARYWLALHEAQDWAQDWTSEWSSDLYQTLTPLRVPLLESYLVVLDGDFAVEYFSTRQQPQAQPAPEQKLSMRHFELDWCTAAGGACHLVPVISQRTSNDASSSSSSSLLHWDNNHNSNNNNVAAPVRHWLNIVGNGASHATIQSRCRWFLLFHGHWRPWLRSPFRMQECADAVLQMAD